MADTPEDSMGSRKTCLLAELRVLHAEVVPLVLRLRHLTRTTARSRLSKILLLLSPAVPGCLQVFHSKILQTSLRRFGIHLSFVNILFSS